MNLSDGSMQFPLGFDGNANNKIDDVTLDMQEISLRRIFHPLMT